MVNIITNLTAAQIPDKVIYQPLPFLNDIWFAIAVLIAICVIVLAIYAWFRISLRNRTNVILHMPDKTRKTFSFKNFVGDCFNIDSLEKDKDGKPIKHRYIFRAEQLESGYFGRYIEYDYLISEPREANGEYTSGWKGIEPRPRNAYVPLKDEFKFMSGIMNTQLTLDLLLSAQFKEFVKMMLVIILCAVFLTICLAGYNIYAASQMQHCSLIATNETINTIRLATGLYKPI
jgi:hypothetical protein